MCAAAQNQTVDIAALPRVVHRYFQAWNAHSPDGVLATLAPTGSYSDPTTNGPLTGEAIMRYLEGFFTAFPDVAFEAASAAVGGGRITVEWLMRGTNRGPLRASLPPTGATVALPGVDVFELEGEAIRSVHGYFDQMTFLGQLGLQVLVHPATLGPVTFGRGVRITTGSLAKPGAFSTTWIDARDAADEEEILAASRRFFADLAQMPGFIGANFTAVDGRLTTQTAWESEASARGVMQVSSHKDAMRRFFAGALGSAAHTSVWAVERPNALWVRCSSCGTVNSYEEGGRCPCGEPFPAQPPYW